VTIVIRRARLALVFVLFCALPAAAQYRRAPTIDDLLDMVQVSAPQISPDGQRVIYTKAELKDWNDNKRVSTVWIADADGSNHRQFLASDKDRNPQWSPDGTRVAFLSTRDQKEGDRAEGDRDGAPQVWILRADGGEAWKLTEHKGSIRSFKWSRDSRQIFFVSEDAKSDSEKAAEKAGDDVVYVDEGPNGQTRGHYTSVWQIAVGDDVAAERKERKITRDRLLIGGWDPSPDASRVVVTHRPDAERNGQYRAELAVIDVATGELRRLTKNEAPESDPRWSPDGQWIAYQAPADRSWDLAQEKVWVVPAAGGAARRISDRYTGTIGEYAWMGDGKAIVLSGTRNGRGGVYQLDVQSGELKTIATGDWIANMDSITPDVRLSAGVPSSPATPADVHVMDLSTGETRRITTVNPQAASLLFSEFRAVTWKSRDGLDVEGLLWLPADRKPGEKLPLLVSIHGGPAGVWTTSFRGINHLYTSLGWAVFEPNVRGSSSYGDALLRGNMKDIGGGDYQDVITGVDSLIAQGIADPDHLAVRGWSYGGILGGWTITQTGRFKAASLGAMVSDWASEYAMGFNHDIRLWYIGGTPWENPEGYRRQSPYTHIAKVTTPTILFHGERDTTDTIGQSMIFYQGLKDRGVPVRFLRFPREPHGLREPHHVRIRDAEEVSWLMKHARGMEWRAPERKVEVKETDADKVKTGTDHASRGHD
jgi:dipeptidyl aminopeptidase/acylaminoacyl peptidase